MERERIEHKVEKELGKLAIPTRECPVIYGVGGTARATVKFLNIREKLPFDNRVVYLRTVDKLLNSFRD